jgi:pSer/pThr/pTyr-binding forkhead associated (FHA) protein
MVTEIFALEPPQKPSNEPSEGIGQATIVGQPPDQIAEETAAQKTMVGQPPDRDAPRLIITGADGQTREHRLTAAKISVGRLASNDIVLDIPTISRHHLRLEREGERYRLQVLSTTNPVFVNGKEVTGEQWLEDGDDLTIGHIGSETAVHLQYKTVPVVHPTMISPRRPDAAKEPDIPMTQVVSRPSAGRRTPEPSPVPLREDEPPATMIGLTPPRVSSTPPQRVVTVSDQMEFMRTNADFVTVMHGGRVLVEGTVAEVQADPEVQAVYLGTVSEVAPHG